MARSELALVGVQVEEEVWARAWGGAATVREHDAHGSLLRRGLEWSYSSITFLDRKLRTTLAAAMGRPLSSSCAFWTRWDKVCRVARPWGEALLVGAWRMIALWPSLAINGVDKDALGTGSGVGKSCLRQREVRR